MYTYILYLKHKYSNAVYLNTKYQWTVLHHYPFCLHPRCILGKYWFTIKFLQQTKWVIITTLLLTASSRPTWLLIFTQDSPASFQQKESIPKRLGIFLPAYHSENSQEQIQRLQDNSLLVYAVLQAVTDGLIFLTEEICKFLISLKYFTILITEYSAYANSPYLEQPRGFWSTSGSKLQEATFSWSHVLSLPGRNYWDLTTGNSVLFF